MEKHSGVTDDMQQATSISIDVCTKATLLHGVICVFLNVWREREKSAYVNIITFDRLISRIYWMASFEELPGKIRTNDPSPPLCILYTIDKKTTSSKQCIWCVCLNILQLQRKNITRWWWDDDVQERILVCLMSWWFTIGIVVSCWWFVVKFRCYTC